MSAKTAIDRIIEKIPLYLRELGADGARRTDLLLRYRCRAEGLDEALAACRDTVATIHCKPDGGLGRGSTRYVHRDFYDEALTAQAAQDISKPSSLPAFAAVARHPTCTQCGKAIAMPDGQQRLGRPWRYCSKRCQRQANSGLGLRALLDQVPDRSRRAAALLVVELDLLVRGYWVARIPDRLSQLVAVGVDEEGRSLPLVVSVYTLPENGTIPDLSQESSAALVFRDGTISYRGQIPLASDDEVAEDVTSTEVVDDASPAAPASE